MIPEKEQGIKEINDAIWIEDEYKCFNLFVKNPRGGIVHAYISLRPEYCDRGHIWGNIEGIQDLDNADMFPRYFFNKEEADKHIKTFLKWRLWKHRENPHEL